MHFSNPWLLLFLAIVAEVVGTSYLKHSEGMTRITPTLAVIAAYGASMFLVSKVVEVVPVGVAYALWSGLGMLAIVLVGILIYGQNPSAGELVGIAMIVAGVVFVNLTGTRPS